MSTKTHLRRWRFFSALLITLLLIGPLVSSAETAVNFPITNNGNTLVGANVTDALAFQFDLPVPATDTLALDGAGYAVAAGNTLRTLVGGNLKFGDVTHGNNNNSYSGSEIIVDSADTSVTSAEVVTPGLANLVAGWAAGQNILYGDENHDNGVDYDGNNIHEIIVNSADNNISAAEIVTPGVADLTAFPASYLYLETDANSTYNDGEDIVKLTHDGATATADGDLLQLFGANDYYYDANSDTTYTNGEAIVSSADANLDNSDTIVTAGSLKTVTSSFCGPAPNGACTYYDPAPASTPYCVVDDIAVLGTINVGDKLVSDTCGTGHGDNYTFLGGEAEIGLGLSAIPAAHRFIDDDGNLRHSGIELVWADDTDLILETGELLFGISSTTALTSLSGSTSQFYDDANTSTSYTDGEDIYSMYYTGAANSAASGDTIRTFDAAEKFSDNDNNSDYTVAALTGPTELIANSADATLSGAEVVTAGLVDVTSMTVNGQQVYSDADGNGLYTDGELIADSADTVLTRGEIRLDGNIDLIGFGATFTYHDGSGDTNYTDGEDIVDDTDNTGYYNADQLTSLKISNPGSCLDTELAGLNIWEDSDGSNTLTGPDNNLGGSLAAPYLDRDYPTSGSPYTATSDERTIFVTFDTPALDGTTVCNLIPTIPNTVGAPFAAQFLSGDDGPTDGDVATTDTTTIDLVAPTPNVADMDTYVVEHAGSGTVANAGDDIVLVWNSSSYGDVASASADFSDFGGGVVAMEDDGAGGNCDDIVAGDDIWCGTYLLVAGNIDDTDNDVTVTLATDAAGNVGADTTDDEQISVDNEAPTVTTANISVTGDSGAGGTFIFVDSPIATWDSSAGGDNNSDIASVTFDASAFLAGDVALNAGNLLDVWTTGLSGAMTTQESINNNVTVTVVDDGGNTVILAGINDYSIDTVVPTPNPADITTTITEHAGSGLVVNAGDDVSVEWDSSAYGDVASVSADFSDFGGGVVAMEDDGAGGSCPDGAAADGVWCATYLTAAGTVDDTDNDVTITLATDTAGNVAGDVDDDLQFSVDNEAPTITLANVKVLGGSGPGGAFLYTDTPVPSWDNRASGDNNPDIASVTIDASDFRPADSALVGGNGTPPYAADFWTASLTGPMPAIESTLNNITVTIVDDGGNSVFLTGTNNYTIDTVVPTPNPANITTTITENAGSGSILNPTDVVTAIWDANSDGYSDVLTVYTDFGDFGGADVAMEDDGAGGTCDDGGAADNVWCASYTIPAGTIDDTDNDVTITLATDIIGNIAADVDDDLQFSVDNEAPVVTVGNISVTGDSGTAGAFKAGDPAVPTWDNSGAGDNNSDIFSVTVDGSAFRAADAAMPAVDDGTFCDGEVGSFAGDGIWCATFTGMLDTQDDINNNVSLTVVDDAGNITTLAGTNDYVVDNELPSFTAVNTVEALLQGGAAPTLSTNLWYYYTGQNLRLQLNNGAETDGNDLAEIKACMRSMNEHSPTQTCAPGDFANPANYLSMSINAGADSAELNYNLAGLPSGWPTQVDGFQMNFELTDDAGNIWSSAAANQYYIAVFNVIPQNIVASLNNATTTDWSTITDFTNVPAGTIVFNSQVLGTDVARMTFNAAMDLTSLATVTGLQALAANVTTTDSVLRLDSSALAAFDIATQLMVKPAGGVQPEFTVKDDTGVIIGNIPSTAGALDSYNFGGHGTASNFVWAAGPGTLTFDVSGFSSYESDVTAPTATIVPAQGTTGVAVGTNVVVTFDEAMNTGTFTYTLAPNPGGLGVVWSGGNTIATISHTSFANSTSYTFSITGGDDLSGNSILPSAATFVTVAASGGGGGGGGGSAAFGAPACSGTACTSTTTDTTEDMAEEDSTTGEGTFTDMTNHWAASFVEVAQSLGYIEGYEDNTFRPEQEINRAEAAKLIAMWMKPDLAECTDSMFTDVSCSEWFAKYVMYLKLMGVIEGYTDGTFRPDAVITRAEALKMVLYAKGLTNPDVSGVENIFSDVGVRDWFYAPVLKGYSMGIVGGYADGTFGPNKPITRAEFTKIFVTTLLAVG